MTAVRWSIRSTRVSEIFIRRIQIGFPQILHGDVLQIRDVRRIHGDVVRRIHGDGVRRIYRDRDDGDDDHDGHDGRRLPVPASHR